MPTTASKAALKRGFGGRPPIESPPPISSKGFRDHSNNAEKGDWAHELVWTHMYRLRRAGSGNPEILAFAAACLMVWEAQGRTSAASGLIDNTRDKRRIVSEDKRVIAYLEQARGVLDDGNLQRLDYLQRTERTRAARH